MGRRQRIRKEKRILEQQAVKQEIAKRYYQETLPFMRILWWLATSVVVFVFGGVLTVVLPKIGTMLSLNMTGPYGQLSKKEFKQDKYAMVKTDQGDIKIEFDQTKKTAVANFIVLAKKNFFDGIKFHRVIKDFMIQAGDPKSKDDDPSDDGTGGPGYTFNDELTGKESYVRGTVAMANSGVNTNGSQFFIVQQDQESLPKNYVVFGKVVSGMDVVDKIANVPVVKNSSDEESQPKTPVVINTVVISDN